MVAKFCGKSEHREKLKWHGHVKIRDKHKCLEGCNMYRHE